MHMFFQSFLYKYAIDETHIHMLIFINIVFKGLKNPIRLMRS